jgi:hypothetical protein
MSWPVLSLKVLVVIVTGMGIRGGLLMVVMGRMSCLVLGRERVSRRLSGSLRRDDSLAMAGSLGADRAESRLQINKSLDAGETGQELNLGEKIGGSSGTSACESWARFQVGIFAWGPG